MSRHGDRWINRDGELGTLSDAIASHAERVSAWEAEVRRVVAGTAPQRDPRVDPQPGDVVRASTRDGSWWIYVVQEVDDVVVFCESSEGDPAVNWTESIEEWRDWPAGWTVDVLWPR